MLELRTLPSRCAELRLTLLKRTMIAAPGENPVGAGDRMAGEGSDDDHRQRRHRRPANEPENAVRPPS